jgi:hypothetical protein
MSGKEIQKYKLMLKQIASENQNNSINLDV